MRRGLCRRGSAPQTRGKGALSRVLYYETSIDLPDRCDSGAVGVADLVERRRVQPVQQAGDGRVLVQNQQRRQPVGHRARYNLRALPDFIGERRNRIDGGIGFLQPRVQKRVFRDEQIDDEAWQDILQRMEI